MTIDLAALEQLAAQATPGPWRVLKDELDEWYGTATPIACGDSPFGTFPVFGENREHDAAFIAACSPDTVTALARAVHEAAELLESVGNGDWDPDGGQWQHEFQDAARRWLDTLQAGKQP